MVTGWMMVESRSMKTMKRIEKQQKPQSWAMGMSSMRLWTVELIQRRRCKRNTFHESGAMVHACALKMYLVLYLWGGGSGGGGGGRAAPGGGGGGGGGAGRAGPGARPGRRRGRPGRQRGARRR